MKEEITLCGDNCIECPRYNAHSETELEKVAGVMVSGRLARLYCFQ